MMKTMALVLTLAFAAALAAPPRAQAATFLTPHDQLLQKLQSTYHTSFPAKGA